MGLKDCLDCFLLYSSGDCLLQTLQAWVYYMDKAKSD